METETGIESGNSLNGEYYDIILTEKPGNKD